MKIKNLLVAVLALVLLAQFTMAKPATLVPPPLGPTVANPHPDRLPLSSLEDLWIDAGKQVRHIKMWVEGASLVNSIGVTNEIEVDYTPGPYGASIAEISVLIRNIRLRIGTSDPTEQLTLHIKLFSRDGSPLFNGDGEVKIALNPNGSAYIAFWGIGQLRIDDLFHISYPGARNARWVRKDQNGNVVEQKPLKVSNGSIEIQTGDVSNPTFLSGEIIVGGYYGESGIYWEEAYNLSDGKRIAVSVVDFSLNVLNIIKGFRRWDIVNPTAVLFGVQEADAQFVGELNFTQDTFCAIYPSAGTRNGQTVTRANSGKLVPMMVGFDEIPFITTSQNPIIFHLAAGNYLLKLNSWDDLSFGANFREGHPVQSQGFDPNDGSPITPPTGGSGGGPVTPTTPVVGVEQQ